VAGSERHYMRLEQERSAVRQHVTMLSHIANLAALMSGFATVFLAQVSIPSDGSVSDPVLAVFGCLAGLTISCNMCALVTVVLLMLAIQTFDVEGVVVEDEKHDDAKNNTEEQHTASLATSNGVTGSASFPQSFAQFWHSRCARWWLLSYRLFLFGLPCFVCNVAILGFVQFHVSRVAAILIAVAAGLALLYIGVAVLPSWAESIRPAPNSVKVYNRYRRHQQRKTRIIDITSNSTTNAGITQPPESMQTNGGTSSQLPNPRDNETNSALHESMDRR